MNRHAIIIALIACAGILLINQGAAGRDHMPLVQALRAELGGISAYSEPVQADIRAQFAAPGPTRCERCAEVGMAYPLTAALLALPLAPLPDPLPAYLWLVLAVGLLTLALALLGMPWTWLLFVPLIQAARTNNPSLLLITLVLLGLWAYREQRWWVLAGCVALTIGAKPQTTLLLSGALAVLLLRAGQWRPLLAACGVVGVITLALDPLWVGRWLDVLRRYGETTSETARWLWYMLPMAGWLIWRGQVWSGLAVLQVALLPVNIQSPYIVLPLLLGYAHLPVWSHALAWRASWLFLLTAWVMDYEVAFVLCLVLPLVGAAAWHIYSERRSELCGASG
jgi:hypothetical protein